MHPPSRSSSGCTYHALPCQRTHLRRENNTALTGGARNRHCADNLIVARGFGLALSVFSDLPLRAKSAPRFRSPTSVAPAAFVVNPVGSFPYPFGPRFAARRGDNVGEYRPTKRPCQGCCRTLLKLPFLPAMPPPGTESCPTDSSPAPRPLPVSGFPVPSASAHPRRASCVDVRVVS